MAEGYQVLSQYQSTATDASGALRDVVVVTFRTPGGSQGSVRVPLEGYSAAAVAELVAQRVAAFAEVEAL